MTERKRYVKKKYSDDSQEEKREGKKEGKKEDKREEKPKKKWALKYDPNKPPQKDVPKEQVNNKQHEMKYQNKEESSNKKSKYVEKSKIKPQNIDNHPLIKIQDKVAITDKLIPEANLEKVVSNKEVRDNNDEKRQQIKNEITQARDIKQKDCDKKIDLPKIKQQSIKNQKPHEQNVKIQNNNQSYCAVYLQKYLQDYYPIEKEVNGISQQMKKIKKIILNQPNINMQQLIINAARQYPMIFIRYVQNNKACFQHLKVIIRDVPALKNKRQELSVIFQAIYEKVPVKFHNLAVFAIQKGKQIGSQLTEENIYNLEQGEEIMFYCVCSKNPSIKFTLFDGSLRPYEFDSEFIHSKQSMHPEQHKNYIKFYSTKYKQYNEDEAIDILNNQQLSSDEDERRFMDKDKHIIENQLISILKKDTSHHEALIQKKINELDELGRKNGYNAQYATLKENIQEMKQNLQSYKAFREKSKIKIAQIPTIQVYKRQLKKMIIAQKQLESKLPIIGKKKRIFQMLKTQQLLIIEGETGSGKSTQLPQMLCQYYELFDRSQAKPVLVTQPRRLATRSLAERVAKEMGQTIGGFVDYVASAGRRANRQAKIVFKLDRLVLDELSEDPLLSKYSCMVIDEAHERTISIDIILGLVKDLLKRRKDFKIIVTSASMDIVLFQRYFQTKTLKVSGRMFPVAITYKNYQKFKEGDKYQMVHKIKRVIDQEILHDNNRMKNQYKGHLLCFCSNVDEINQLVRIFEERLNKNMFAVYALHGRIMPQDQRKVFQVTGKYKFIFASRIAQTAITIDGVKVVIDPGLDYELIYDQKFKFSSMKLQDISQSSAKQRAGRSGRTGPGHCFRLYSEDNFKKRIPNKTPEIENSSLETVVLRLKTLRIRDPIAFPFISKPSKEGLQKSLQILSLIGALNSKSQVTKIGQLLIKIPIQPFLSRAIVEAIMFQKVFQQKLFVNTLRNIPNKQLDEIYDRGVKNTVIQILALVIIFSNLFYIKKEDREKGQQAKFKMFSEEDGDFFFLDNIYRKYKELSERNHDKKRGHKSELSKWMWNNYLNPKALNQASELITEISKIVQDFQIRQSSYKNELQVIKRKLTTCKSYRQVILSCLITSFSANLCKYSKNPNLGYTIVNQKRPIQIYGTSNLSLLGINCDWIICYDLYTNEIGRLYCKVAHRIDYNFMRNHIDKNVWNIFDIEGIQKKNPFYEQVQYNLPTKIIHQLRSDYKDEYNPLLNFLRESFPLIIEEKNIIKFYILSDDKAQKMIALIDHHITQQKRQFQQNLRYNYLGNIYVNFSNGFLINGILFNNKQLCVEIVANYDQIEVIAEASTSYGSYTIEDVKSKQKGIFKSLISIFQKRKKKLKVCIVEDQNKMLFQNYIIRLSKQGYQMQVNYKQTIIDKTKKMPKTKILMKFFAGESEKDIVFLSYQKRNGKQSLAKEMIGLIQQVKNRQAKNYNPKFEKATFALTQKQNGINIYNSNLDQEQVRQQLSKLRFNKYNFIFPNYIKKFRNPDIHLARRSDQQWIQQIQKLMDAIRVDRDHFSINIWGYYQIGKYHNKQQQNERVQLTAQLLTFDNSIFAKLKEKYNGRKGVIGSGKVHFKASYDCLLVITSSVAFMALKQQYQQLLEDYHYDFPLMTFKAVPKRITNKEKIFLYAQNPYRQDFVIPQQRFAELFTAKLIKLQPSEYNYLDKLDSGRDIIDSLQSEYKQNIYFGFDRLLQSLRVYCNGQSLEQIQYKLRQKLRGKKYYTQQISYKGKNLNRVVDILNQQIYYKNKNTVLSYQIIFQFKEVLITSDLENFQRVKNQILKLDNTSKSQCLICLDIMKSPYRLINCSCSFCWACIANHIRSFRNNPSDHQLACPGDKCKTNINMNDAKTLITQDQFQKICDIKISQYISKHANKYLTCKFCENIFDKSEILSSKEVSCEVCGRTQCFKCNDSHPNYTCFEWSKKLEKQKNYQNYQVEGIKQCPRCNIGIELKGGCNSVKCRNCSSHICWKCLKYFNDEKQCAYHIEKYCGGLFGRA